MTSTSTRPAPDVAHIRATTQRAGAGGFGRALRFLPALTLLAVLTITASAEYELARTVLDLPPQIAWALPAAIDSYVLAALHTRRDVPAAIAVMAGALLAAMGAHLAHAARDGQALPVTWTAPLATVIMTVLIVVAWRVHVLITPPPTEPMPRVGDGQGPDHPRPDRPSTDRGQPDTRDHRPDRGNGTPTVPAIGAGQSAPLTRIKTPLPIELQQPIAAPHRSDPGPAIEYANGSTRSPEPTRATRNTASPIATRWAADAATPAPDPVRRPSARPSDVARLREAISTGALDPEPTVEAIRRHLQISPNYARAARAALPPTVTTPDTPPNEPTPTRPTTPSDTTDDMTDHRTTEPPDQAPQQHDRRTPNTNTTNENTTPDSKKATGNDSEQGTHAVRLS